MFSTKKYPHQFKLKTITIFVMLIEYVVVLTFILRTSMVTTVGSNLKRTASAIRDKLSSCPSDKMKTMLNTSIHASIHEDVTVKDNLFSKCLWINESATGLYRLTNERNFRAVTCNKTEKRFLDKWEKPVYTALASFPGSGNTWVRHLLEELTGIHTGSLYMDLGLRKIFHAERYTEGVIAIKTHEPVDKFKNFKFDRAILLIRDPFDTLLSSYNLGKTVSHTDIPTQKDFNDTSFVRHLTTNLKKWSEFYLDWLQKFDGQTLVLFYDILKTDLLNSLTKMAAFFEMDVTMRQLWCIQSGKDGFFRRGQRPNWMERSNIIDDELNTNISIVKRLLYSAISERVSHAGNIETN